MYPYSLLCLVLGALTFSHNASAQVQTQFDINCPGRSSMTVVRAVSGLSTLSWDKTNFQVAAGLHKGRLDNGNPVTFTRFRNGDRLLINTVDGSAWFVYAGEHKPVRCQRSDSREAPVLTLQYHRHGDDPLA
ncbi:hypothetical protein TUM12370_15530 [Salmonella enterica subsp. enterica serovar Choleraesuis]|nr:hypothetical protein TUM12370_15530 [Salmonella enterica subsp. enterica serovar Choleraesuis]